MLLDPGDGDVAASDLQIRLDLAQLIAELALLVGPDAAAGLAVEKIGADELVAVVPLLQPVALARSTRKALRRRRDVLPAVRKLLLAAVPGGEVTPVQLERIRPRTLVTLVASVVAVYLLAGELARASLGSAAAIGGLALGRRGAGAVRADLRRRGAVAVRVRRRAAELRPHAPRPAGRLVRHAGHARRRGRRRAEHSLPAAQEDPGAGRGGQRRRVPGRGVRPAHPAAGRVRRDRGNRRGQVDPPADVGLLRAGRARRDRAGRAGDPGRAADAARPAGRRRSARCCRGCSRSRSSRASSPRASAARCC